MRSFFRHTSIRTLYVALATVVVLFCGSSRMAHADTNAFTVTKFDARYDLSDTDKQGLLRITETIDVVFTDNNHGLLRAIPQSYKDTSLGVRIVDITSASGAPTPYDTYNDNGNLVLKIGDPDKTVTGSQSYTIAYEVENVISFYDGYDEFYWDVNGDGWRQPFENVTVSLVLPEGVQPNKEMRCFTGYYGSTASDCTVAYDSTARTYTTTTTRTLLAGETLSIVAAFPKQYFMPVTQS